MILPLETQQVPCIYLEPCLLLSMLLPKDKDKLWYMTHFIQLCAGVYSEGDLIYNNGYSKVFFEDTSPDMLRDFFLVTTIDEATLHAEQNMAFYIRQAIDDTRYCIIDVDEYYITGTYYANKVHYYRKFLIYGYDKDRQCFYAMSQDRMTVYRTFELTFQLVNYLLHLPVNNKQVVNFGRNRIAFYKPLLKKIMEMDIHTAATCLTYSLIRYCRNERLQSTVTCDSNTKISFYYGTDIYALIINSIMLRIENIEKMDYRAIRVMLEHKAYLEARLKFLQEYTGDYNLLSDEIHIYEDLQKQLKAVLFIFLRPYRLNLEKRKQEFQSVIQTLMGAQELEVKAMRQLLCKLNEYGKI